MGKLNSFFCLFLFWFAATSASDPEENLESTENLFEGDMKLSHNQRAAIDGQAGRGSITTRKWTGGVLPYVIHSSLSGAESGIQAAFNEWEQKTCIRFRKRTTERNYVEFFKGSGCWSYVGMYGGRQQISLGQGCWNKGTTAHEIGYALGFYHEQSRPDRDLYVKIMLENIYDGMAYNFGINKHMSIDSLGTPYDYGSIMHYGARYFSKNGQPTIVPLRTGVTIGNRKGLSDIDALQMRRLYSCPDTTHGLQRVLPPATNIPPPQTTQPPAGCKDSDAYASECPTPASYPDYCTYHHDWTKKYCAKSCGWCS